MGTAIRTKAPRNNNLDLLRLLSCVAVIVLHVNWIYFGDIAYSPSVSLDYIGGSLVNIVTRFCVPCFVMISGAFLLHGDKNADIGRFYKRALVKTFIPFIFVTVVFLVKSIASNIIDPAGSVLNSFKMLLTSGFSSLWYMYMLAGLYLITPFVVRVKQTLTSKQWMGVGIVLMVWAIFSQAMSTQMAAGAIGVVFAYLSYFVLGNVLYEYSINHRKSRKKFLKYSAFALGLFFILFGVRFTWGEVIDKRWIVQPYTNFFSPLVVMSSLCVFWAFLNLTISWDMTRIVRHTFMIYLVHGAVYPLLDRIAKLVLPDSMFISIVLVSTGTFVISLLASVIYNSAETVVRGAITRMTRKLNPK